jgi:hypothetical protein
VRCVKVNDKNNDRSSNHVDLSLDNNLKRYMIGRWVDLSNPKNIIRIGTQIGDTKILKIFQFKNNRDFYVGEWDLYTRTSIEMITGNRFANSRFEFKLLNQDTALFLENTYVKVSNKVDFNLPIESDVEPFSEISQLNNEFPSIMICDSKWMTLNLDVVNYRNGDKIPQVSYNEISESTFGAWCYYNNDPSTNKSIGKLYNWYAVNDPRGLAPNQWHIASDREWSRISKCLGANIDPKPSLWGDEYIEIDKISAFATFPSDGSSTLWWTSTDVQNGSMYAIFYSISYSQSLIKRSESDKNSFYYVRCVED